MKQNINQTLNQINDRRRAKTGLLYNIQKSEVNTQIKNCTQLQFQKPFQINEVKPVKQTMLHKDMAYQHTYTTRSQSAGGKDRKDIQQTKDQVNLERESNFHYQLYHVQAGEKQTAIQWNKERSIIKCGQTAQPEISKQQQIVNILQHNQKKEQLNIIKPQVTTNICSIMKSMQKNHIEKVNQLKYNLNTNKQQSKTRQLNNYQHISDINELNVKDLNLNQNK